MQKQCACRRSVACNNRHVLLQCCAANSSWYLMLCLLLAVTVAVSMRYSYSRCSLLQADVRYTTSTSCCSCYAVNYCRSLIETDQKAFICATLPCRAESCSLPLQLQSSICLSAAESCSSQYNSCLTVITSNYLAYATAAAAAAGPASPPEVRKWQQDMKTSQLEILERCRWRVHLDLQTDMLPALQQLQQVHVVSQLQTVLRQTNAECTHRRAMDAQLEAHRRYHANQAQQAQHFQMQQAHGLACCESSTKPAKPRANMRLDHPSHHHARLRHEAEELHQHSLDGRYWQSDDGQDACHQHDTLISMGQRARSRAVRTKLSFFTNGSVP